MFWEPLRTRYLKKWNRNSYHSAKECLPPPSPLNHNCPLGVETVYTKLNFPFRLTSDFNYRINFQFINESAWTCIHLSFLKLTEGLLHLSFKYLIIEAFLQVFMWIFFIVKIVNNFSGWRLFITWRLRFHISIILSSGVDYYSRL